jgi:hypothetical protein
MSFLSKLIELEILKPVISTFSILWIVIPGILDSSLLTFSLSLKKALEAMILSLSADVLGLKFSFITPSLTIS